MEKRGGVQCEFLAVELPPGIAFTKIHKEPYARGKLWVFTLGATAVVSQRVPMEAFLNTIAHAPVHRSSLYRVIRGQQSRVLSGWRIHTVDMEDVDALNKFLDGFQRRVCVASKAAAWRIKPQLLNDWIQSTSSQSSPGAECGPSSEPRPAAYSPASAKRGAAGKDLPAAMMAV